MRCLCYHTQKRPTFINDPEWPPASADLLALIQYDGKIHMSCWLRNGKVRVSYEDIPILHTQRTMEVSTGGKVPFVIMATHQLAAAQCIKNALRLRSCAAFTGTPRLGPHWGSGSGRNRSCCTSRRFDRPIRTSQWGQRHHLSEDTTMDMKLGPQPPSRRCCPCHRLSGPALIQLVE